MMIGYAFLPIGLLEHVAAYKKWEAQAMQNTFQKQHQANKDNSWHERGELPPVGCECECNVNDEWTGVYIIGAKRSGIFVMENLKTEAMCYINKAVPQLFRPLRQLRTEREKAIDEMKSLCAYPGSWESTFKPFAEALYDAGYRKQE